MSEEQKNMKGQGYDLEERCTQISKMITRDPIAAAMFLDNMPDGYLANTTAAYIALAHSVMRQYSEQSKGGETVLSTAFQQAATKYIGQKLNQ